MQTIHCVIPAGGVGSRMGHEIPKQYLRIGDKTILQRTLEVIHSCRQISTIVVGLATGDDWWQSTKSNLPAQLSKKVVTYQGGPQRSDTVLNGLNHIMASNQCNSGDWVMVHDAARPCVSVREINQLIEACIEQNSGGILAQESVDTLKRITRVKGQYQISETEPRSSIWRAATPQMFPLHLLKNALDHCKEEGINTTDEAEAMEKMGYQPILIPGSAENIKITNAIDLMIAEKMLCPRN